MDMEPMMGYDQGVQPPPSHHSSVSSVHNSQHSGKFGRKNACKLCV